MKLRWNGLEWNKSVPDEQEILSFSALWRFTTSSVSKTAVGNVGEGLPRMGGLARDICSLYQAVALRMPEDH